MLQRLLNSLMSIFAFNVNGNIVCNLIPHIPSVFLLGFLLITLEWFPNSLGSFFLCYTESSGLIDGTLGYNNMKQVFSTK
ncbi:hypothetical protein GWI33_020460 [Rhynchophorus ferrugineus]|uniref:Uncharacterized protein n=1 Tax=Rhynchophorus ferrugineus TaxID=354439 RepID=A0A834HPE1_RHYFE|nr:hypothetical protein GWI33_020460 [Rhynchophorus ferrugineus]